MRILVVNAGSSSLKLSVLDDDRPGAGLLDLRGPGGPARRPGGAGGRRRSTPAIDAVGHRIVHGGTEFTAPVLIDDRVRRRLEALTDLAPLHQPKSLRGARRW